MTTTNEYQLSNKIKPNNGKKGIKIIGVEASCVSAMQD